MKIGIIGSGNIGATAARLFAKAGHEVAISNSRGPETLRELVADIGPNVRAATVEEAAEFGEVVLEAIPFGRYKELPVEPLVGKVVVDAANYYPQRDGEIDFGGLTSSSRRSLTRPGLEPRTATVTATNSTRSCRGRGLVYGRLTRSTGPSRRRRSSGAARRSRRPCAASRRSGRWCSPRLDEEQKREGNYLPIAHAPGPGDE